MSEDKKVQPRLSDLESAKINFSDATINLEIAQGQYDQAKKRLVELLRRPPMPPVPQKEPKKD